MKAQKIRFKIIIDINIDKTVFIILSIPKELTQLFIDLALMLPESYPQIQFRIAEDYFKFCGKDYKALYEIFKTIIKFAFDKGVTGELLF
jgi:hypothetical protein